jgi:deazaflavin-dependent oxidoreductase (nitroreductase family)
MPLPGALARFNRVVTNRIVTPFARRLSGFCVLRHTGRKTGNSYETPVNAWRDGDLVFVALTYGPDVDWLKNTMAAEGSVMVMQGEEITVGAPEIVSNGDVSAVLPGFILTILGLIDVDDFAVYSVL